MAKDALFAPARVKLPEAYLRTGNVAGALAEAVRAADLPSQDLDARLIAGSLLLRAGRIEDAKSRADRALAGLKDPSNPVFHFHLGLAYAQNGNKAAARQALERAPKLKGDFEGADEARKLLGSL